MSLLGFMPMTVIHHVSLQQTERGVGTIVTKRRSGWTCIGNPKLEQETIEGTHARETPAYQRRPTTLHEVQGSKPPIRALYMQLAMIPRTHHTTPCATIAPGADKPARHPGATGTGAAHTQLKARRRGNSPAPESMSRH